MKKLFVYGLIAILLFAVFTACDKSEPKEVFGECIISADYEDLTQEEYTTYLQEAYGLDALVEHKVYHSDGNFQVDFKFSKEVKEWQLESARKFAIDKFYSRDIAKYDLWNYDVWLIEHLEQESISVTYRIFTESKLTSSGVYPEGDFTFNLSEGYSVTDITDRNCSIIRDEDGTVVGGIILTQLTEESLDENILRHLNSVTGKEVLNEYFCWNAESNGSPVKLVDHYATNRNTNVKEEFHRILFVKDGGVYDMWFDTNLISMDEIEDSFYSLF